MSPSGGGLAEARVAVRIEDVSATMSSTTSVSSSAVADGASTEHLRAALEEVRAQAEEFRSWGRRLARERVPPGKKSE